MLPELRNRALAAPSCNRIDHSPVGATMRPAPTDGRRGIRRTVLAFGVGLLAAAAAPVAVADCTVNSFGSVPPMQHTTLLASSGKLTYTYADAQTATGAWGDKSGASTCWSYDFQSTVPTTLSISESAFYFDSTYWAPFFQGGPVADSGDWYQLAFKNDPNFRNGVYVTDIDGSAYVVLNFDQAMNLHQIVDPLACIEVRYGNDVVAAGDTFAAGSYGFDLSAACSGSFGVAVWSNFILAFTPTAAAPTVFQPAMSVGGSVSGLSSGTVVLQNNGTDDLAVSANGVFTFVKPIAPGASYNVTVLTQPTGQTCAVTSGSGTMADPAVSNVTGVTIACTAVGPPPATYNEAEGSGTLNGRSAGTFKLHAEIEHGKPVIKDLAFVSKADKIDLSLPKKATAIIAFGAAPKSATISGTGVLKGVGNVQYVVTVTDGGSKGKGDTYRLQIPGRNYDTGAQTLKSGDIDIQYEAEH